MVQESLLTAKSSHKLGIKTIPTLIGVKLHHNCQQLKNKVKKELNFGTKLMWMETILFHLLRSIRDLKTLSKMTHYTKQNQQFRELSNLQNNTPKVNQKWVMTTLKRKNSEFSLLLFDRDLNTLWLSKKLILGMTKELMSTSLLLQNLKLKNGLDQL